MSASSPVRPPLRKPSRPVGYIQSQGANVWPSFGGNDEVRARTRDGEMVVVQEFLGNDLVAVNIGGRDCVMKRAEWRALPLYTK